MFQQKVLQSVSFHSWEPSQAEIWRCMRETKLIDWHGGPLLTNVDLEFCDKIKQIAMDHGTSVQRARTSIFLVLENEKAAVLNIEKPPDGFHITKLSPSNAQLIHELWPSKKEGSLEYVRGLINFNITAGIFRDNDNELIAWAFQNDFSGLGILQVLPSEQRKGFGSLITAYLCKQVASVQKVALSAWIANENFKSKALLENTGFQTIIKAEWIQLNKA